MRLDHIVGTIGAQPWAVSEERWRVYQEILLAAAAGRDQSAEELRARFGIEAEERPPAPSETGVAVIPIYGDIAQRSSRFEELFGICTSTTKIAAQFRAMMAEPAVGAVVFDIHSHGGSVYGVHELHETIRAARGQGKKIIAQVNSIAASAAYWIASAADEIVSTPGGDAGSIGVYCAHVSVAEALAKAGLAVTVIKAGKYKAEGDPMLPLSDEARKALQSRADAVYSTFVADVAAGRGVTPAAVREGYGQGRVLGAKAAKAEGMVDRIATFEETVGRLVGRKRSTAVAGARADDAAPEIVADDPAPTPDPVPDPPPAEPSGEIEIRRRALDLI